MRLLILIALMVCWPAVVVAATVSARLDGLVGDADFPATSGKTVSFDLGVEFLEISRVSLEIEARVYAKEFDSCGTVFNPQPCTHETLLLGFFGRLDTEDVLASTSVISEALSFSADPHATEGAGIDVANFNAQLVGWDYLLDGAGNLTLHWNDVLLLPGAVIRNVVPPSGNIASARLIVEGVVVPEPSPSLLLAVGLAILARGRRARKANPFASS